MNPVELLVLIVVAVFAWRLLRDHLDKRDGELPPGPSDDTRLLAEEVARLRERVQVLERVVTDNHGSVDLDRRIEALRDIDESRA